MPKVTQVTVSAGLTETSQVNDYGSIRRDVSFSVDFEQPLNNKGQCKEFKAKVAALQKIADAMLDAAMKRAHIQELEETHD